MTTIQLLDTNNEAIKIGDFIREVGEFADPRKFQIVEYTKVLVMNEDGNIVANFPFSQEHIKHFEIVSE